jgi:hypothetical protein
LSTGIGIAFRFIDVHQVFSRNCLEASVEHSLSVLSDQCSKNGDFLHIPALRQVLWLGALNKRQDFR